MNFTGDTETTYRKCRAGRDRKTTEPQVTFEHCIHAQDSIRREECKKCGRKKTVNVFGCQIHGECTILNYGLKGQDGKLLARCFICPDYEDEKSQKK
jgi:hypothetical protein